MLWFLGRENHEDEDMHGIYLSDKYEVLDDERIEINTYFEDGIELLAKNGHLANMTIDTKKGGYIVNGNHEDYISLAGTVSDNEIIAVRGLYDGIAIAIEKNVDTEANRLNKLWYTKQSGIDTLTLKLELFNERQSLKPSIGLGIKGNLTPEMQKIVDYFQTRRARLLPMKQKAIGYDLAFNVCKIGEELILVGINGKSLCDVDAEIVVPEGITAVYDGAIDICKKLTIPKSVTYIGHSSNIGVLEGMNDRLEIKSWGIGKIYGKAIQGNRVRINYNKFIPTEEQYKYGGITRVLYEDDGHEILNDKAVASSLKLTEAMILRSNRLEIGEE